MRFYSIGHGEQGKPAIGLTMQDQDSFLNLLIEANVTCLVDIRSMPGSNRHPQYNQDDLKKSLKSQGIKYVHLVGLGGRRRKCKDKKLADKFDALKVVGFRNYGAHMHSEEFKDDYKNLLTLGKKYKVAFMCSESLYFKCHRKMISDRLVLDGHEVEHLNTKRKHQMWELASVEDGELVYKKRKTDTE